MLGLLDVAIQLSPAAPENVRLTCCGWLVDPQPAPIVSELGKRLIVVVLVPTIPVWVIATVWPAMVKDPVLICELLLGVTVQLIVFPKTETVAQDTFEPTVGLPQEAWLGVTENVPDEPEAPTSKPAVLRV